MSDPNDKRVCILHVGGTIGMVPTRVGLVPDHEPDDGGPAPSYELIRRHLESVQHPTEPQLPGWDLHRLDPLVDSADMSPGDWSRVARRVVELAPRYDGFVVLHGTDTMAYTASALSFLLHEQHLPVICTGAQLPLVRARSDGREHLVTSLLLAASAPMPETCIYFGGHLLRGNRAQKTNNDGFVAYESPNLEPLASVGAHVQFNRHLLLPPQPGPMRAVPLSREPVVTALRIFPGLQPDGLRRMLAAPVEGVVLETYGAGTFPSGNPELLSAVAEAVARGVVVVNVSQCLRGRVRQELYGTGRALADVGVTSGHDLTPEAALTKLYCVLAAGNDPARTRQLMEQDLAGEVTPLGLLDSCAIC